MSTAFLMALVLSAAPVDRDSHQSAASGPQPLVVWIQTDPWAMVIGADTPRLAVYDDGTQICLETHDGAPPAYLAAKLSRAKLDEMRQHILGLGSFEGLKRQYDLTRVTDQPTAKFFLNLSEQGPVTTEVYGLMTRGIRLPAYTTSPTKDTADRPPDSILLLHKYVTGLRCEGGTTWTPTAIEVMLWPYEYAPDESIAWPRDWPGLTSPDAVRRGDSYSIYLAGTKLDDLRQLLRARKPKGALALGGKKWAVSYRYVFPSEPVWSRAFRRQ